MAEMLAVPISYFFGDLRSDDAELSPEDRQWREYLQHPETIEFIRLYYAIPDPKVRRDFLEMAKTVAVAGGEPATARDYLTNMVPSSGLARSRSSGSELSRVSDSKLDKDTNRTSSVGSENLHANLLSLLIVASGINGDLDRLQFTDEIVEFINAQVASGENLTELALDEALKMKEEEERLRVLETLCTICDRVQLLRHLPRMRLEVARSAEMLGRNTQAQSFYLAALKASAENGNRSVAIAAMESLQSLLEREDGTGGLEVEE
jgi:hypothetical protein